MKVWVDFLRNCVIVCMARLITEPADTLTALPCNYFKDYYKE